VSAFTLFLSHDNRKSECNPTMNFFIRRFFRLAPMLYIGILVIPFYVSESPRTMHPPSTSYLVLLYESCSV
jgi:peptidoglycan/LPS O-acetylase OafA/YrhL